jgi:hypothetical protein
MHKLAPNFMHKLAPNLPNLLRAHTTPFKGECVRVQCVHLPEFVHDQ